MFLGVCLVGVISLEMLPLQLLPEIEFPRLTVVTPYENASPSEMEQLITKYIEESVSSVNGVLSIYSESIEGLSLVTARFQWGTNMDLALIETKEKVDIIKGQLPQDTGKSIVVKFDPKADPVMIYAIADSSGDFTRMRQRIEKEIVPYLERIEGVAIVDVIGGYKRQININLDSAKIYAHGLSIFEIVQNVGAANYSFPAGYVEKAGMEYLIRTVGEFTNAGEITSVVVGRNDRGVPIYLKDIGETVDGFKDRKCVIRLNGRESIGILLQKEPGKNTIEVCKNIEEKLESLQRKYKSEFSIKKIYDQSEFITSAIDNVFNAAIMGGIIAIFVLYFFLKNLAFPLIIATSIPISILGTFGLMYFKGMSINTMSLGGLALGVGVMVDAGTVVLESISTKLKTKKKNQSAIPLVLEGTRDVLVPVTASTLTTVIVFIPLVFVSGLSGAVFGELALTVSFSLVCALICSFFLTPMLATIRLPFPPAAKNIRALKPLSAIQARIFSFSDSFMAHSIGIYTTVIDYSLHNKKRIITLGVASFVLGTVLFLFIDTELMPRVDPGEFTMDIELPKGAPIEETSALSSRIGYYLLKKPYVRDVYEKIGSDPEDNIAEKSSGRGSNNILIHVFLKENRRIRITEIVESLQKEIRVDESVKIDYHIKENVIESLFSQTAKPLTVEIYGREKDELVRLGEQLKTALSNIKGVVNVASVLDSGHPELRVNIDREIMSSLDVDISSIASTLRSAVHGEVATKFREKDDEIDVRVRLKENDRSERDSLYKILVKTGTQANVPLSKFAEIKEGFSPGKIVRSEQSRVNIITADIEGNKEIVFAKVEKTLSQMKFGEGYEAKIVGEKDEIKNSFLEMRFVLILAVVLVYMVLAAQFQSFINPLILMLSIPVTILGVSASLLVTGATLNINSGIGIVMLVGNVVNNAIILFDFIDREVKSGKGLDVSIIDAGKKRLAPILNTTLTTILALIPMALGMGEGSEIQQPMAIAVIGGLTISTFLTMVFVPTVYAMVNGEKKR